MTKQKTLREIIRALRSQGIKIQRANCTLNGKAAYLVDDGPGLWNAAALAREYYFPGDHPTND